MAQQRSSMTLEQLEELKKKLNYLKVEGRQEVTERIQVALGFGDLSENAEYDEARNDQGKLEAEIAELESIIANAIIIDEASLSKDVISIGSRVEIELMKGKKGSGRKFVYHLVSSSSTLSKDDEEAVIASDDSPVAEAIIGHKVGDIVNITAPKGVVQYKIVSIL